jgi:hypothetical protein
MIFCTLMLQPSKAATACTMSCPMEFGLERVEHL